MWFKTKRSDTERELDEKFERKKKEMREAKQRLDDTLRELQGVTSDVAEAFE
jgi:hypothetical protein